LSTLVVAGPSLLAPRQPLSTPETGELRTGLVGEAVRLNDLPHYLLSVTHLEAPSVELQQSAEVLEDIVCSALKRLRPRLARPAITLDLLRELALVLVEPALVEQRFTNLLENAPRHTPEARAGAVSASAHGVVVVVRAADEGPGIPAADREKVFETFFRGCGVDPRDGGVRLGLTTCRSIVHAHGGRIKVHARKGGGAAGEFTLPRAGGGGASPPAETMPP